MSKLLTYGLYLLALILPLQTRYIFSYGRLNNGPWSYGDLSLYGLDILIIILGIIALVWSSTTVKKIIWPKYLGWLLILLIVSAISIIIAPDQVLASFALIKILLGITVFWLLISQHYDQFKFWLFFLTGACLEALTAIWQFGNQGNSANKWLGLSAHTAKELGASVVEAISPTTNLWERWLRAYGTLDHPNILGGLLALSLLIAIIWLIKIYKDNLTHKKIYTYLLLGYIVIMSAGLFFTFSRTAWLALTIGCIILIIQHYKNWRSWLLPLVAMLIIFGCLMWSYHYLALSRFGDLHRIEVQSINERLSYRDQAQQMIQQSWLTGQGLGNYGLVAQKLNSRQVSYWYQPVHNTYLLIFAEIGIVGILAVLLLLAGLTFYMLQQPRNPYWPILVAWLILMGFDHWWWSLHYGQLLFWLLLAMLINQTHFISKK